MDELSIAILCGGKSTRFKKNKADFFITRNILFQNNFDTLVKLSDDIFLQGTIKNKSFKQNIFCDIVSNKGALGGIYSALTNAKYEKVFIMACDMPNTNQNIIFELKKYIEGNDIIIPRWENGFLEPLCAIYSKSVINIIKIMLENNELKISNLFEKVDKTKTVSIDKLINDGKINRDFFKNINRIEEYHTIT